MNSFSFLMGILPLLFFVIVDSFLGLKAGLITAVLLAAVEAGYSLYAFGEIDWVTGASFVLVAIMGWLAWKKQSDRFLLFQPVVVGVILGGYLLISYAFGHPLFLEMADKYQNLLPPQMQPFLSVDVFRRQLEISSWTSGIGILLHAAVTAFAALKLSKWWWIAIRGVGFYFFLFAAVLAAKMLT